MTAIPDWKPLLQVLINKLRHQSPAAKAEFIKTLKQVAKELEQCP